MRQDGFILIESLIYIGIGTIMVGALCMWVAHVLPQIKQIRSSAYNITTIASVMAQMAHDFESVASYAESWKALKPDAVIWKGEGKDRGWSFANGKLFYCTGHYNVDRRTWSRVRRQVILSSLDKIIFSFSFVNTNDVESITCEIVSKGQKRELFKQTIHLKNGLLL